MNLEKELEWVEGTGECVNNGYTLIEKMLIKDQWFASIMQSDDSEEVVVQVNLPVRKSQRIITSNLVEFGGGRKKVIKKLKDKAEADVKSWFDFMGLNSET